MNCRIYESALKMSVYKSPIAKKSWLKMIFAVGIAAALSLAFQTVTSRHEDYSKAVIKDGWKALFDGKTLKGWHALPGGTWNVEDGILVGRSDQKEERHGILVSDKQYKNFEIEVVFKAVKGNSGLYSESMKLVNCTGYWDFKLKSIRLRM
jgi:hypothetical protein